MEWTEDDVYDVANALQVAAGCSVEVPCKRNDTKHYTDLTFYTIDNDPFINLIQEDEGSRPYLRLCREEGMGHTKVVFKDDYLTAAKELFKALEQWNAYAQETV